MQVIAASGAKQPTTTLPDGVLKPTARQIRKHNFTEYFFSLENTTDFVEIKIVLAVLGIFPDSGSIEGKMK